MVFVNYKDALLYLIYCLSVLFSVLIINKILSRLLKILNYRELNVSSFDCKLTVWYFTKNFIVFGVFLFGLTIPILLKDNLSFGFKVCCIFVAFILPCGLLLKYVILKNNTSIKVNESCIEFKGSTLFMANSAKNRLDLANISSVKNIKDKYFIYFADGEQMCIDTSNLYAFEGYNNVFEVLKRKLVR
ncbi:MAG: hypothetical protein A2Y12_01415 [Planctomycetes bacterium GWF2_42_9]|nr:MAG: hypothetical protein A2Y12_01415 [Planctomycetes bacterium GWF2_42_9]